MKARIINERINQASSESVSASLTNLDHRKGRGMLRDSSGKVQGRRTGGWWGSDGMGMGRVVFYVLVAFGDGEGGERGVAQPGGVGEDEGRDEDGAVLGDARDANLR